MSGHEAELITDDPDETNFWACPSCARTEPGLPGDRMAVAVRRGDMRCLRAAPCAACGGRMRLVRRGPLRLRNTWG